jgi:hypothetical protein
MFTRTCIMAALVLLAGPAAAACVAQSPVATARWIFEQQSGFAVFQTSQDRKVMQAFLSPSLFQLLQTEWSCQVIEEGLCALDTDPWLNAGDEELLGPVSFDVTSISSSRATVEMQFRYGKLDQSATAPGTATLWLVLDTASGCWLLEDLVGGKGKSLRKTLADYRFYP